MSVPEQTKKLEQQNSARHYSGPTAYLDTGNKSRSQSSPLELASQIDIYSRLYSSPAPDMDDETEEQPIQVSTRLNLRKFKTNGLRVPTEAIPQRIESSSALGSLAEQLLEKKRSISPAPKVQLPPVLRKGGDCLSRVPRDGFLPSEQTSFKLQQEQTRRRSRHELLRIKEPSSLSLEGKSLDFAYKAATIQKDDPAVPKKDGAPLHTLQSLLVKTHGEIGVAFDLVQVRGAEQASLERHIVGAHDLCDVFQHVGMPVSRAALSAENIKAAYRAAEAETMYEFLRVPAGALAPFLTFDDFVYLSFDTPTVRRLLVTSALHPNVAEEERQTRLQQCYAHVEEGFNCYELLLCPQGLVNPRRYFTLSAHGITQIFTGQHGRQESAVITIPDWLRERALFLQLKRIKFFRTFQLVKAIRGWKSLIGRTRFQRGLASLQRTALFAAPQYVETFQAIGKAMGLQLCVCRQKPFSFYGFAEFQYKLSLPHRTTQKDKADFERNFTCQAIAPITLRDFVIAFREDTVEAKNQLVRAIHEVEASLLERCRQIHESITTRLINCTRDPGSGGEVLQDTVMDELNEAVHFTEKKMRALVRAVDCFVSQRIAEEVIGAFQSLFKIFFGAPLEPINWSGRAGAQQKQLEQMSQDVTQTDQLQALLQLQAQLNIGTLLFSGGASDLSPDDEFRLSFERNIGVKTREMDCLVQSGTLADSDALGRLFSKEQLSQLSAETPGLQKVQLFTLPGHLPSQPVFQMLVIPTPDNSRLQLYPAEEEMLWQIQDCVASFVQMALRLPKAHWLQGLRRFLGDVLPGDGLAQFDTTNPQNCLLQRPDFQEATGQLTFGLQHAYRLARSYLAGIDPVLRRVLLVLEEFDYGCGPVRDSQSLCVFLAESVGVPVPEQSPQAALCLLKRVMESGGWGLKRRFFEHTAFPGLREGVRSPRGLHALALPKAMEVYAREMPPEDADYLGFVAVVQPDQFQRRCEELQEAVLFWRRVKCARALLCFSVDTTQIHKTLETLLLELLAFVQALSVAVQLRMHAIATQTMEELAAQMNEAPDFLSQYQQDIAFPRPEETTDTALDFSPLAMIYQPGQKLAGIQLQAAVDELKNAIQDQRLSMRKAAEDSEPDVRALIVAQELAVDSFWAAHIETPLQVQKQQQLLQVDNIAQLGQHAQKAHEIMESAIDYSTLELTQRCVQAYERARACLPALIGLDTQLFSLQKSLERRGVINKDGSVPVSQMEFTMMQLYKLDPYTSSLYDKAKIVRDEVKAFDNMLQAFVGKRLQLYLGVKRYLLCIYINLMRKVQQFWLGVLQHQNTVFCSAYEGQDELVDVIFKGSTLQIGASQQLCQPAALYLFFLFQKQFGLNVVRDQLFYLQTAQENLAEFQREAAVFNRYIELFDTADFYLSDGTDRNMTELDHSLQAIEFVLSKKHELWTAIHAFQSLIQEELSQPIALMRQESVEGQIRDIQQQLAAYTASMQAFRETAMEHLSLLSAEFKKDNVIRLLEPKPIYSCVDADEETTADVLISFSVLKQLLFCYRTHIIQRQQLQQDINETASCKALKDVAAVFRNQTSRVQIQFVLPEPPIQLQFQEFLEFKTSDLGFFQGAKDAVQVFFSPQPIVQQITNLLELLFKDIKALQVLKTTAVQPKHYIQLAGILPPADLNFELNVFNTLLNMTQDQRFTTVLSVMQADSANAYRQVFGPRADGVSELLAFSSSFVPQQGTAIEVDRTDLVSPVDVSGFFAFLQSISNLKYGDTAEDYEEIEKLIQEQREHSVRSDTDTEDQHIADTQAHRQPTALAQVTIGDHVRAIRCRLYEIVVRRKRKRQQRHAVQTESFGKMISLELDRFTTSVSRLVFRGYLSTPTRRDLALDLLMLAQQEYSALEGLAQIKTTLNKVRLPMKMCYLGDGKSMYVIADTSDGMSVVQDQLVKINALQIRAGLLKSNADIIRGELAVIEKNVRVSVEAVGKLMRYQTQFTTLHTVFLEGSMISKALPDEARAFTRLSATFQGLTQMLFEQQLFLACRDDVLTQLSTKMIPETESIQVKLNDFFTTKRSSFSRFYFLAPSALSRLLCVQISPDTMDRAMPILQQAAHALFDNVTQFKVQMIQQKEENAKYYITGLMSREGELLAVEQISTRQPPELWLSQMVAAMQIQLKRSTAKAYKDCEHVFAETVEYADALHFYNSYPTQCVCVARECFVAARLLALEEQTKHLVLDQLTAQQDVLVSYIVNTLRSGCSALDTARFQAILQNELHIRARLLSCKKTADNVTIWAILDAVDQTVYLTTLAVERIRNKAFGKEYGSTANLLPLTQYKYEYTGAAARICQDVNLTKLYGLASEYPAILFSGERGCGKSSVATDYSRSLGQFWFLISCQNSTDEAFTLQCLQGACIEGCTLIFDEVWELDPYVISAVCVYLKQIQLALQTRSTKVVLNGIYTKLSRTIKVIATGSQAARTSGFEAFDFQQQFRHFVLTFPDSWTVYSIIFRQLGFFTADELAARVTEVFRLLRHSYIIFPADVDLSFRRVRQLGYLVEIYYKQWGRQMKSISKLAELLGPKLQQKSCKEQMAVCAYLEEMAVIQAFHRLFASSVYFSQLKQFMEMLSVLFNPQIVELIFSEHDYEDTIILKTKAKAIDVKQRLSKLLAPGLSFGGNSSDQESSQSHMQDLGSRERQAGLSVQTLILQAQGITQQAQVRQAMRIKEIYLRRVEEKGNFILQAQYTYFQQFEQALWIRSGVILVGPQSSGKTALWKNALDDSNLCVQLRPAMHTIDELVGHFDNGYFVHGIIPDIVLRFQAFQASEELLKQGMTTAGIRFLQINGSVSPELAEFISSALDDSHSLTLPSGEKIYLNNYIRFIFEVHSLEELPASVLSRCAVVRISMIPELADIKALARFRQLFSQDYEQFKQNYAYDAETKQIVLLQTSLLAQNIASLPSARKLKAATQQRFAAAMRRELGFSDSVYANTVSLYAELIQALTEAALAASTEYNPSAIAMMVCAVFEQYAKAVKNEEPMVGVRIARGELLLAFQYAVEQVHPTNSQHLQAALAQKCAEMYQEVYEVLRSPPPTNLQNYVFHYDTLAPCRIAEIAASRQPGVLGVQDNALVEQDIISINFIDGRLWIQSAHVRCLLLRLWGMIAAAEKGMVVRLDPEVSQFLVLQFESNNIQPIIFDCRSATRDSVLTFIVENCTVQSSELTFKESVALFFIHFQHAEPMLSRLIETIRLDGQLFVQQYDSPVCWTLSKFFFFVDAACDFADASFVVENFGLTQALAEIKAVFNMVRETFHKELSIFMQTVVKLCYQRATYLDRGRLRTTLEQLCMLSPGSFALYQRQFETNSKRYLLEAVVQILLTEYIGPAQMQEQAVQDIIITAYQASTPGWLGTEPMVRTVLQSSSLWNLCTLTPVRPRNLDPLLLLTGDEQTKEQQQTSLGFGTNAVLTRDMMQKKLEAGPRPLLTFYEAEGALTANFEPNNQRASYLHSKLIQFCSSQIPEVLQRFSQLGTLLCSTNCVYTANIQQELTLQVVSQLAEAMNLKLIASGDVQLARKESTKQLDSKALADVLILQLQTIIAKQFQALKNTGQMDRLLLFVKPEFVADARCLEILRAVIVQRGWCFEVLQKAGLDAEMWEVFQKQGQLNAFGLMRAALVDRTSFLLLVNSQQLPLIHEIFHDCGRQERFIPWSLNSIAQEACNELKIPVRSLDRHTLMAFNGAVQSLIARQELRDSYMTSQQFKRFLQHYNEVLNTLQNQNSIRIQQLTQALEVIDQAAVQSKHVQDQIKIKRPPLEEKQKQVSEFIKAQAQKADEVNQMKRMLQEEQKAIHGQLALVEAERTEAQSQLNAMQPILQSAMEALSGLSRSDAAEIAMIQNPSPMLLQVVQAVCILLQEALQWNQARLVVGRGDFISRILKINPREVSERHLTAFRNIVEKESFDAEKIKLQSKAFGALATWANAFLAYCDVTKAAEPRLKRVEALEETCQEKKVEFELKSTALAEAEQRFNELTQELFYNQQQLADLNKELNDLNKQLENLSKILALLTSQKEAWNAALLHSIQKQDQLAPNALQLSVYNVLQLSEHNITHAMKQACVASKRSQEFDVAQFIDFIFAKELAFAVARFAQTNDLYTQLSLLNLSYLRNPLVLDSDGQFMAYCEACSAGRQALVILEDSGLNQDVMMPHMLGGAFVAILVDGNNVSSFIQTLQREIPFNLLQLVYQNYPPEPKTVALGEMRLEISPRFQLVLVDVKSGFAELSATVLNAYDVVQFKKQRDALRQQLLQVLLRVRAKELQTRYGRLLEAKATSTAAQASNEIYILQKLGEMRISSQREQSIILNDLERVIGEQKKLHETIASIKVTEDEIQLTRRAYQEDAAFFSNLYTCMTESSGYRLNLFIRYLEMFPQTQKCTSYLMRSLEAAERFSVQLQFIFQRHAEQCRSRALVEAIQRVVTTHKPSYIVIGSEVEIETFQFTNETKLHSVEIEEVETYFQASGEAADVVELDRRRRLIGMLICGLFWKTGLAETQKAKLDSVIQSLALASVVGPLETDQVTPLHPQFQQALVTGIISDWQRVTLPLLSRRGNAEVLIDELCVKISSMAGLSETEQLYVGLLLCKTFTPERLQSKLRQFIEAHANIGIPPETKGDATSPGELLSVAKNALVRCRYADEEWVIQQTLAYLSKGAQRELLRLEWASDIALPPQGTTESVLIVRRQLNEKQYIKLRAQDRPDIILMCTQEQPRMHETPRYYVGEEMDIQRLCSSSVRAVSQGLQNLLGVSLKGIWSRASQFLAAGPSVSGPGSVKRFYQRLQTEVILQHISGSEQVEQPQFESASQFSGVFEAHLESGTSCVESSFIKEVNSITQPLRGDAVGIRRFIMEEQRIANRMAGARVSLQFGSWRRATASLQACLAQHPITVISGPDIYRLLALLDALRIHASHIYGSSAGEYELEFTLDCDPLKDDLFLAGASLCGPDGSRQAKQIRVRAVKLVRKKRTAFALGVAPSAVAPDKKTFLTQMQALDFTAQHKNIEYGGHPPALAEPSIPLIRNGVQIATASSSADNIGKWLEI